MRKIRHPELIRSAGLELPIDSILLRLAGQLEQTAAWRHRRPAVWAGGVGRRCGPAVWAGACAARPGMAGIAAAVRQPRSPAP
ncbi:putative DNA-binding protein [Burkholderia pseudomallei]|nr:putative dNA-binding protein [Burkholderia pseudomallei]CAJ5348773.1 putative DNA-binding protein [Burkholderia pseudomallei]CAJ8821176.1 putative DNA-binding protein [Burkholderia pseudomallei]VBS08594.1 putative DNA-binding protein [Burkholderia pseudomallei]